MHCSPRLRLICACIFPTGLAFNTELLRFFFFKVTKPQGLLLSLSQKQEGKKQAVMVLFFFTSAPIKRLNPQGEKK